MPLLLLLLLLSLRLCKLLLRLLLLLLLLLLRLCKLLLRLLLLLLLLLLYELMLRRLLLQDIGDRRVDRLYAD